MMYRGCLVADQVGHASGPFSAKSRPYTKRPYADLPASFLYLGNQGDMSSGTARASASVKETFEIRVEPVSSTTPNVKVLPTEL